MDYEWAPPPGYHYEWYADKDWRVVDPGRRCRYVGGNPLHGCGKPAVAALLRGTKRPSWWCYCEQHLFGRRINNGVVESRCLRPNLKEF